LALGDGIVSPSGLCVVVGDSNLAKRLAEAVGSCSYEHDRAYRVVFPKWFIQNAHDLVPSRRFEKNLKLYITLANYIEGVKLAINGRAYLLRRHERIFKIFGEDATKLAKELKRLGIEELRKVGGTYALRFSFGDLEKLERMPNVRVEYLDEVEFEEELKTKAVVSDEETRALLRVRTLAHKVSFPSPTHYEKKGKSYENHHVYLWFNDEDMLKEAMAELKRVGYGVRPVRKGGVWRIAIARREYVEALKEIEEQIKSQSRRMYERVSSR